VVCTAAANRNRSVLADMRTALPAKPRLRY
jgi:hypothetical protein